MKLMICGHGRHGKDTVANLFQEMNNYKFISSSWFVASWVIFPELRLKYGYANVQECFEDRANRRTEWFDLIAKYNSQDLARLSKEILATYDMYVGIRNHLELDEARRQNVFDLAIWVEADKRRPPESSASNTITRDMCDIVILNNLDESHLREKVIRLARVFRDYP